MKKTDKKFENAIRKALTAVCEIALEEVAGFKWITHFVDYDRFPESLSVVCIFGTTDELSVALSTRNDNYLRRLIKEHLRAVNIQIKSSQQQINFATEDGFKNERGENRQNRKK